MADLHEIMEYMNHYLNIDQFDDFAPNGLQVEGAKDIYKILFAVSASHELFQMAKNENADAIVVHHGMFWDNEPKVVTGILKERLKLLLDNNISLFGYHLPLDAHNVVGNNIQIGKLFDFDLVKPFRKYQNNHLGIIGLFNQEKSVENITQIISNEINRNFQIYQFGNPSIKSIGIISGAAPDAVREIAMENIDLYLTGESTEWVYHFAKESKIHYVAAGHYATERFGVKALAKIVESQFQVETQFVDIDNPI